MTVILLTLLALQAGTETQVASPQCEPEGLHSFLDARSVSVRQDGSAVVVDVGRRTAFLLPPGGEPEALPLRATHPWAVDASSTLSLLVADAVSGTIDRVGRNGDLMMRLHVPTDLGSWEGQDPGFLEREILNVGSSGQPGDVAHLPGGGVVASETSQGGVLFWDAAGRPVRAVRTIDGAPMTPGKVAVAGEHVFVVDSARPGLVRMDPRGAIAQPIGVGLGVLRVVASGDAGLWTEAGGYLLKLDPEGRVLSTMRIQLPTELVDMAVGQDALYLLTKTMLYRVSLCTD